MNKKSYTVEEIKKKLERYCAYQDRCHQEVEKKLQTFFLIKQAKETILLHLLEHDFLNEERFAKSFARGKFRIKNYGRVRIRLELLRRNISENLIEIALQEIEESEYQTTLETLAKKKNLMINEPNLYKRTKKVTDFLLRKGYENQLVYKKVAQLVNPSKTKP